MEKLRMLFRIVVIETLIGVGIVIGYLIALILGLIVVASVILWLLSPAATPPIIVPSPDGKAAVKKQYGPLDEAGFVELRVVSPLLIFRPSYHLATVQNPTGVMNEDGATISWDGNRHIVVGWPMGGVPVQGPSRIRDIQISYREYDPVLSHVRSPHVVELPLHGVKVTFQETHVLDATARYVGTGRRVEHVQCVVKVSGFDGSLLSHVTAEVGGIAAGSGVGLKVSATRLSPDLAPQQTLTQAEFEGVFPKNDLTSAPGQQDGAVRYRLFTASEAKQIFAAIEKGEIDLLIGMNLGEKVVHYKAETLVDRKILDSFNSCSAKASLYGSPFSRNRSDEQALTSASGTTERP
jgi:hypothetical protein